MVNTSFKKKPVDLSLRLAPNFEAAKVQLLLLIGFLGKYTRSARKNFKFLVFRFKWGTF
jgi:F0F1-type ATP synthase membrane subunit a